VGGVRAGIQATKQHLVPNEHHTEWLLHL